MDSADDPAPPVTIGERFARLDALLAEQRARLDECARHLDAI